MANRDLIVSGVSGRFAESNSVNEFWDDLINGVDALTDDLKGRWVRSQYKFPRLNGTLKNITHFDREFFGLTSEQANCVGPGIRILLEVVYEAIVDAGLNPEELRGSKTGVYMALTMADMDTARKGDRPETGFWLDAGAFRYSELTSFYFDLRGPSMSVDTACASGCSALSLAHRDLQAGQCDRAIVGGANFVMDKRGTIFFRELSTITVNGKSCPFDEGASGYIRSEAVTAVLIEPAGIAKRSYAQIVGIKTMHDGFKEDGILKPGLESQKELLRTVYLDADVNTKDVAFIECHGTSTQAGDIAEVTAIGEVMTVTRDTPFLIGSLKSSHGHTEAASGLVSLIKCLMAVEHNLIPANLNYSTPNPKIPYLLDGRVKVVAENTLINDYSIVGFSTFGVAGSGGHVIIQSKIPTPTIRNNLQITVPRLIPLCGRNEEAIDLIVNNLDNNSKNITADFLALLDGFTSKAIPGRGMDTRAVVTIDEFRKLVKSEYTKVKSKPQTVLFVPGLDGQLWPSVAEGLRDVKIFFETIEKCSTVLKQFELDLQAMLFGGDGDWLRDQVLQIVVLTAMQIAFIDLLRVLRVQIDGIVGFSTGAIAVAYADGCLDLEQAMLVAYWLGELATSTNIEAGQLVAIGMTHGECVRRCPRGVLSYELNGAPFTMAIGPQSQVEPLVREIIGEGKLALVLDSSTYAYHNTDIDRFRTVLTDKLREIIPEPRARSPRWITIIDIDTDEEFSKFAGPEFFVNCLASPVQLIPAFMQLPNDLLFIAIGSLSPSQLANQMTSNAFKFVNLMSANSSPKQSLDIITEAIGQLYLKGLNPDISQLYPKVEFPVEKGTAMLSHLIKWKHDEVFDVHLANNAWDANTASDLITTVDINKEKFSYLTGHVIDGQVVLPGMAAIRMVWEALARSVGKWFPEDVAIELTDVKFGRAVILNTQSTSRIAVRLNSISHHFTVLDESDEVLVSGNGRVLNDTDENVTKPIFAEMTSTSRLARVFNKLSRDECYQELRARGMDYDGLFRGIETVDADGRRAVVKWASNFMAFIESCLQISLFNLKSSNHRDIAVPSEIRRFVIDSRTFQAADGQLFEVCQDLRTSTIASELFVAEGLQLETVHRATPPDRVVEKIEFVPNCDQNLRTPTNIMKSIVQVVYENTFKDTLNVYDSTTGDSTNIIEMMKHFGATPLKVLNVCKSTKADLIITNDGKNFASELQDKCFLIAFDDSEAETAISKQCSLIIDHGDSSYSRIRLYRKVGEPKYEPSVIKVSTQNFEWSSTAITKLQSSSTELIWLVSIGQPDDGIIGFVNCLRGEAGGYRVRCIFAPFIVEMKDIDFNSSYFNQILKDDLVINVLDNDFNRGQFSHQEINWNSVTAKSASLHYFTTTCRSFDQASIQRTLLSKLNNDVIALKSTGLNISEQSDRRDEYSGQLSDGRRIMGTSFHSVLGQYFEPSPFDLVWPIPESWTFEEAATIPISYVTSLYGLIVRAQLSHSESILITCAAGAIGQSAVNIAKFFNCKIFATVGSENERDFLERHFHLATDVIFDSRDENCDYDVMRVNNGEGVDVVLNCLTGDQQQAGLRCLKAGGRFVALNTNKTTKTSTIFSGNLVDNPTLIGIDIRHMIGDIEQEPQTKIMLEELVQEYIVNGAVQPIKSKVEDAEKLIKSGDHSGKLVYTTKFDDNKSFVIVDGLGNMGLELLYWMFERGARKFVVTSPSGVKSAYQRYSIERLRALGCDVRVSQLDVSNYEECEHLFDLAKSVKSVGGIFNLASIRRDAQFESQAIKDFEEVAAVHISVTRNLDSMSCVECPGLEYYVCFLSVASGQGLTSYGYANSVTERICERRRKDGHHGLVVKWGLESIATSSGSCLLSLDNILNVNDAVVTSYTPRSLQADNCDSQVKVCEEKIVHVRAPTNTITETIERLCPKPKSDQELVFSGMSGRFAESDNVEEFWNNLMNGVDMTSDDLKHRWDKSHYNFPPRNGTIKDVTRFDSDFFGITPKQANEIGPGLRIMFEVVHEALVDAGINPEELSGTKTGVYVAFSVADLDMAIQCDRPESCVWMDAGAFRIPNLISFFFNFKGPSIPIDSENTSSFACIAMAQRDLEQDHCDRAIVAAMSFGVERRNTLLFTSIGALSPNGFSCPFDERANGYVRSEAVAAVILEPLTSAKRNYGQLINIKMAHDGYKEEGIFHPSFESQQDLLSSIYKESNIEPKNVTFVECFGTSNNLADVTELKAIGEVLTKSRDSPLLIGSVKSNHGHAECASGLVSLIKCLLALDHNFIPANLHYEKPNPKIDGLVNGKLRPVTKNTKLEGESIIGISGNGFSGSASHMIIKSAKQSSIVNNSVQITVPRLITFCGRNEEGANWIAQFIEDKKMLFYEGFLGLLSGFASRATPGKGLDTRGAILLDGEGNLTRLEYNEVKKKPPLWFLMSGMGCHWAAMGNGLMDIEPFARSIKKCAAVLEPFEVDLIDILTSDDGSWIFDHVPPFTAITSIQIALIDTLRELDIHPDGVIGFSIGEIAAAYADGCLDLEQAVLVAYWRGRCVELENFPPGLMAAVGLSWEDCERRCPPGVLPACHSAEKSVTISGPKDAVLQFVEELNAENVFAVTVHTNEIAYHHPGLEKVRRSMMSKLENLIPKPKRRSSKWLSAIQQNSDQDWFEFANAKYFVNNLVSPVMFLDALKTIPKDSLVVEIGSHRLLANTVKKTLPNSTYVCLMHKNRPPRKNVATVMEGIGKLYLHGLNPTINRLYPKVTFPVLPGTPHLSPLIKWIHDEEFRVHDQVNAFNVNSSSDFVTTVDIHNIKHAYLTGHVVGGSVILPGMAALRMVWEALARSVSQYPELVSVELRDVEFVQALVLAGKSRVSVRLNTASQQFTVFSESGDVLVTGFGRVLSETGELAPKKVLERVRNNLENSKNVVTLSHDEVYREWLIRGMQFGGLFKSIESGDTDGRRWRLKWSSNVVTFMDASAQVIGMRSELKYKRKMIVLKGLRRMVIDPRSFSPQNGQLFECLQDPRTLTIATELFFHEGLRHETVDRSSQRRVNMEKIEFVLNHDQQLRSQSNIWRSFVNLICENIPKTSLNILDTTNGSDAYTTVVEHFKNFRTRSLDVGIAAYAMEADLIVVNKESADVQNMISPLRDGNFLIAIGLEKNEVSEDFSLIVDSVDLKNLNIRLYKKVLKPSLPHTVVEVSSKNFDWVPMAIHNLQSNSEELIWFVSCGEVDSGVVGFINCLRQEPGGHRVRCLFAPTVKNINKIDFSHPTIKKILSDDLRMNVLNRDLLVGHFTEQDIDWTSPITKSYSGNCYLAIGHKGDLSSVQWISSPPKFGDNLISVKTIGLNFRDMMQSLGQLSDLHMDLGLEYSAQLSTGRRIMGTSVNAVLEVKQDLSKCLDPVWSIPEGWTFEQAATVPFVYVTCLYGMVKRGHLTKGESILIHCGARDLGQSAINIAQFCDCTIFVTVGSNDERFFLKNQFGLSDDVMFNSSDISFESNIMRATNGKGVDMVVNILAGERFKAGLRCLKRSGRFVELGKMYNVQNSIVGLETLSNNRVVIGVDMRKLIMEIPKKPTIKIMLEKLVQRFIDNGAVKPIVSKVFEMCQVEDALRLMDSEQITGKLLINTTDLKSIETNAVTRFDDKKSYVIVGGLGGMGLELMFWMYEKGARRFVVTSRSGVKTTFQQYSVERLRELGCDFSVVAFDVSKIEEAQQLLAEAKSKGIIGGIFNLAVSLQDALFENQTVEKFEVTAAAKVSGTRNLDKLTREQCQGLDYFVCFSSVTCGHGNAGQTNYGFANSVMERICERRRADGHHGMAIEWGFVADVGAAVGMNVDIMAYEAQPIQSCLEVLGKLLLLADAVVTSYIPQSQVRRHQDQVSSDDPLEHIAHALGARNAMALKNNEDKELFQLGANSLTIIEVKQLLVKNLKEGQTIEGDVKNLTFRQIRKLINI